MQSEYSVDANITTSKQSGTLEPNKVNPYGEQRKQALLQLLKSWLEEGDEEEQKATWEALKQGLDEDRLPGQKLFP